MAKKTAKEKAAEAAAKEAAPKCCVDGCESPAKYAADVDGEKVESCEEHKADVSAEFDPNLTDEDWSLIEPAVEQPKAPAPASANKGAPAASEADAPYDAKRRAQLVQAIRAGGCVKLPGGKRVKRVEDLP